jgi:glycosyltransferase involved in cell wall biosynthesis
LRILHVIGNLQNGGAEAVLYRLATARSTTEHHVVSFAGPGWYSEMLAAKGVNVYHLGVESRLGRAAAIPRLMGIMRRLKPNVVQAWMYRSNVVAGLCAALLRIPVVWGIHCSSLGPLSFGTRSWVYASSGIARFVPSYVVNCSTRSKELHERIGYSGLSQGVVHNGYDTEAFHPDEARRAQLRDQLGVPPGTFLVGTVARWHAQKDHPNLISALKVMSDAGDADWRCLFVGPDMVPDFPPLAEALSRAGIGDRVICAGPRRDVDDIMRGLDLHILPSAGAEAFPNVIAEAMASGTPCLATDVGDCAYMIGDTGWIVPPSDPAALAEVIGVAKSEWAAGGEAWRDRCARARQRIVENFTLARMVAGYEAVWRKVAQRSDPLVEETSADRPPSARTG